MRHRSVQSRAGILTAAAVMAVAGFGVSAAQANLVLDLKFHDTPGASSMSVAPNAVVNLDVFGTVTGSGALGLQDAFFGVTNSGTVGNLSTVTLASPFTGVATDVSGGVTTSTGGTLYGPAGGQSVGSTDSSVADGWVFARSTSMTPVTNGTATLLGTLEFTAATAGTTNLALNVRSAGTNDLIIPAIWQENGAEVDTGVNGGGTLSTSPALSITVASAVHHPGDTNNDGVVDLTDLNNVLNNFGVTATGNPGDDNTDGTVDLTDLNNVLNNFGTVYSSLSAVPEPASLSLLGLVGLGLIRRRK
jgi:hypothetical protein